MIALVLFILFGGGFAYFATQNTLLTTINLGGLILPDIPVYFIVIFSFAFGLLTGGFFGVVKNLLHSWRLNQKQTEYSKAKQESVSLAKRIHQLELENTKLKTKLGQDESDDDSL